MTLEYRSGDKDGTYRWMLARGTAIRDEAGKPIDWSGSRVDITELKLRTEEAERRAKEAAEAASRAKSEFLANVSHEIRTPMNAILGMTELAIETSGSDEQRQYLTIVKSSADALLNVINDLLDFSKIEAGKLELDSAEFSLRSVLGETLRALALRAHKKGLELVCQIQPDVPDALIGDAGRLRQILLNLVGNAIKFTEEGEVVVRIEAGPTDEAAERDSPEGRSGPSQVLGFSVSDTGIGIPLDKQQKIFQAFEQEDNSTTRRYGGTGLGLSIATRLVALMRGGDRRRERAGPGQYLSFHGAIRPAARPARPADGAATGRAPGAARPRRGRQRDQSPDPRRMAPRLADRADGGRRRTGGPRCLVAGVGLGPALPPGGARRPDAGHRRPGPGRAHPPEPRALPDPDHPADLRRPPR